MQILRFFLLWIDETIMLTVYRSAKLLHQEIRKHVSSVNWYTTRRPPACVGHHRCHDDAPIGVANWTSPGDDDDNVVSIVRITQPVEDSSSVGPKSTTTTTTTKVRRDDKNMVLDVQTKSTIAARTTTTSRRESQNVQDSVAVVPEQHIQMAEIVWEYMLMHHTLTKSDLIFVLGNNDVRVAKHAAQLWLDGYAEYIMISGHLGNLTEGCWTRSEYEVFREVALDMGVPSDRILVETKATNTGQNVRLSYDVLKKATRTNGASTSTSSLLPLESVILVQTPYMERRTYATFMKQWPDDATRIRVQVTSPKLYLRQYPVSEVGSLHDVICILLGCFQRVLLYPAKGYQIHQDVPDNVVKAYNGLADAGLYGRFLSKS